MEKVVMLIWSFRDDPSVVTFMARFVAKVRAFEARDSERDEKSREDTFAFLWYSLIPSMPLPFIVCWVATCL